MKIFHVPCLQDNYSYLIIDESTGDAAVVDPVDPEKVIASAEKNNAKIKFVLTTHHHWDHAGGNEKIKQLVPGIKVYGGSLDKVKGCTDAADNGDKLSLGQDVNILALHTPCHTKGHISYYVTGKEGENPAVFTGDTLFVAGCGKFFEGTAEQMHQSLCVTLASLPKPTQVYCGHEYTVKNLEFALTVEPNNEKIQQKLSWARQQRQANLPTIPSTLEEELETNPFMRVDNPEIQEKLGCKSPIDTLREIRNKKDQWRGLRNGDPVKSVGTGDVCIMCKTVNRFGKPKSDRPIRLADLPQIQRELEGFLMEIKRLRSREANAINVEENMKS